MNSKKPVAVSLLIVVLIFQSITAIICGALLMIDPSGGIISLPLTALSNGLFNSFFIPGFILFTFLGLLPMLAGFLLITKKNPRILNRFNIYREYSTGWMLSLFSGFGTIIWIAAQQYIIREIDPLQTIYSAVGIIILVLTLLPSAMHYCKSAK